MSDDRTKSLRDLEPGALPTRQSRPGLVVLFSEATLPTRRAYPASSRLTVGRQAAQRIYLEDPAMSRHHATFRVDQGALCVRDEGSRNGTSVSGRRLPENSGAAWQPLAPGDVVRCGTTLLLVTDDVAAFSGWPESANVDPLSGGPAMERIRRRIAAVSREPVHVLISGESGTGKELATAAVHRAAIEQRAAAFGGAAAPPFVAVNCAALPRDLVEAELFGTLKGAFTGAADRAGLVQKASGGTLFLDEIGDLPLEAQSKLLRVIETHEYRPVGATDVHKADFRLLTATHRDLGRLVDQGDFRLDLFHRIRGAQIELPSLRERKEDIVTMANAAAELELSSDFVEHLLAYRWPGNVRELVLQTVPAGATVRVNENVVGVTKANGPISLQAAGRVALEISKPGFRTLRRVLMAEFAEPQQHLFQLARQTGRLQVTSDRRQTEIFVGNKRLGRAPLTASLVPGVYQLVARAKAARSERVTVRIVANQTTAVVLSPRALSRRRSHFVFAELAGGPSIASYGAPDQQVGWAVLLAGSLGYRWQLSRVRIAGLVSLLYTPIEELVAGQRARTDALAVLAGVDGQLPLWRSLSLDGRVLLGTALFIGAPTQSFLLPSGGTEAAFALRLSLGLSLRVWQGLTLRLTVVGLDYTPAGATFNPQVERVLRLQLAGIGIGWSFGRY